MGDRVVLKTLSISQKDVDYARECTKKSKRSLKAELEVIFAAGMEAVRGKSDSKNS